MTAADWGLLMVAATAAGWVDAVVGGGGLILLPAILLVAPQLAPQAALATNKMTAVFGTFAAVVTFSRRIALDWRLLVPAGALAAVASAAGAAAVSLIDRELFIPIIMVVLIAVAALVTARPTIGSAAGSHAPSKRKTLTVVFLAAGGFGFYDGILGPGTGTFFIIAFATLLGTEFVRSAAMAKVLNLGSNLGALAFFAVTGHVLWQLGAAMAVCNVIGAVSGSRIALARGSGFVRVVLLVVVFGMVIRLGWQQFG
ncbi:TSUP family transporter [Rhodococcus sp. H36-A4]|uniref:TSUP family transporter n=1 Tax=unclassified Rhodococcus (in: high G+C Gram-positive bacteria) TaxID=192944 RepID=UPI00109DE267|nr:MULTISPECIES: TSUP family transporter [unclassified Rhodococcus (in: high G+C Gram-positive bacteria)]MCZ4079838.1 TSUP family transporter [Rhodococcus sp. H36-A4]MDJ0362193.1 TSUP family transporter [Rhodococcus sp. H29-C3]QCB51164.1 sulfite exporter TauE/SafE family protein [Rhodococcus sp. PAMC28705]QCB57145.1 sulfite exporter TauE/SafE family protein [Rhodococcus sp. PAMC28707]